jgi:hypothetical protein
LFKLIEKYLNQPKQVAIGFIFIFLFHIIFKSLYLDYNGFWYDETFGLWYSQQDWGLIKHTSEWDLNPPLYYYFLWIWRNLFGISEFSIRFSSVLFSALAAGMIFIFSAKFFNRTTAFLATLIFSASTNILFFAHEARCYSIVLFLALCSSWLFLNLLQKKNIASLILLGITNFLLIYTHYLTGFILFFQIIIALYIFQKEFIKQIAFAFGITLILCFLRFTPKTISLILHHQKNFWLNKAELYDLKTAFFDFFNGKNIFIIYILVTGITIGYLLFSKSFQKKERTQNIKILYVLCCGIFTFLLCFLIGRFTPLFLMRYLLYTSPFMYIAISYFISLCNVKLKYTGFALVSIVSVYSFCKMEFRTPKSMNYRDAMPVIKKLQSPTTVILAETKDMAPLFSYYYDKAIFTDYYNMVSRLNDNNIFFVSSAEDVKMLDLKKYNKIILTQSFDMVNPENAALLDYLNKQYKLKATVKYYNEVNILAFTR